MKVHRGQESNREWTQYGFRWEHKNHAIVIQRTLKADGSNPWWYTFHLQGMGRNDPVVTLTGAPLSRQRAESYAREYIRNWIK